MAGVWGLITFFNFIFYGKEMKWHKAMITYGAFELLDDPEFKLDGADEADEAEFPEEETMLMNDQDWSW